MKKLTFLVLVSIMFIGCSSGVDSSDTTMVNRAISEIHYSNNTCYVYWGHNIDCVANH